jgi:glycosyltransferase involved in cell wall biosynthesis
MEVLANGDQRRAMATAARARAVTAFDVRTCYQKTTAVYERVLT